MPWWAWVLIAIGVLTLVCGFTFRNQLRFAMKLTKALATDERLPRPLRWAIGVALAMKVVPVPDFGIDEIILVLIGVLLLTVYRPTFREIVAEIRGAADLCRHCADVRPDPSAHIGFDSVAPRRHGVQT